MQGQVVKILMAPAFMGSQTCRTCSRTALISKDDPIVFDNICACILIPGNYISTKKYTGICYINLVDNIVITSQT